MNNKGNILLILLPVIVVAALVAYFTLKTNPQVQKTFSEITQKIEEPKTQVRTTDDDISKQLVDLEADSKNIDNSLNDQQIDVLSE